MQIAPKPLLDRDIVRMRLEEAGATLLAMPGGFGPRAPGCGLPPAVQSQIEAYGWSKVRLRAGRPSAEAIDRMDESLGWISLIPASPGKAGSGELFSVHGGVVLRRLLWWRLLVDPLSYQQSPGAPKHLLNWRRCAEMLGADRRVIPMWHSSTTALVAKEAPPTDADYGWAAALTAPALNICNLAKSGT